MGLHLFESLHLNSCQYNTKTMRVSKVCFQLALQTGGMFSRVFRVQKGMKTACMAKRNIAAIQKKELVAAIYRRFAQVSSTQKISSAPSDILSVWKQVTNHEGRPSLDQTTIYYYTQPTQYFACLSSTLMVYYFIVVIYLYSSFKLFFSNSDIINLSNAFLCFHSFPFPLLCKLRINASLKVDYSAKHSVLWEGEPQPQCRRIVATPRRHVDIDVHQDNNGNRLSCHFCQQYIYANPKSCHAGSVSFHHEALATFLKRRHLLHHGVTMIVELFPR